MGAELAQLDVLGVVAPGIFRRLAELKERLRPLVGDVNFVMPGSVQALQEAVADSCDRYEALIVAGGDGTINRVVNAMDLERQKLIVLPAGRGNDFVRTLGLPRRLDAALRRLPELSFQRVDAAMAGSIRYVNSAGIGLDAEVLERMQHLRGRYRRSYVLAFMLSLPRLRPLGMSCDFFPRASSGRCWWVVIMNGRWIGGGIPIAPRASLQDGKLDGLAVTAGGRWGLAMKSLQVLRQRHLRMREVEFAQEESFDIEALNAPLPLAIDGELYLWNESRLRFRGLPRALTVLC